jgi:hypothetical protein
MTKVRTFRELLDFQTFDERLDYLRLGGGVGRATFGFDRHINQKFYASSEWKHVRDIVIIRDNGCDLGVPGHEIPVELLIHHMNPLSVDDILTRPDWVLNPNYLITTSLKTHNAIHYGGKSPYPKVVAERVPGDTNLWQRR